MSASTVRVQIASALVFLTGALVLNAALTTWWKATVIPAHKASVLDREYLSSDEPLALLVAGGSHARNALQDDWIEQTLNVSVAGQTWAKTSVRLPWLIQQGNRRVQRVMLTLDHATFSSWKTESWQPEGVWGQYVDFAQLGVERGEPLPYLGREAKARLAPYAGELETLGQLLLGRRQFRKTRGDAIVPPSMRRWGREAAALHFDGHQVPDPVQLDAFERTMAWLTEQNIDVTLVAYPVSRPYLRAIEARQVPAPWDLPRIRSWIDHPHVEFWNESETLADRIEMFYDGDHINARGAALFTAAAGKRLGLDVGVERQ